jgi:hypothetical protein
VTQSVKLEDNAEDREPGCQVNVANGTGRKFKTP